MNQGAQMFGRYQLLRQVGAGGMAEVHLARQIGPSGFVKPCVLKRISPSFMKDERYRRMFLEEARISALLNHPHIVQSFDYGEVEGVPYIAMELVDGLNLAVLCRGLAKMDRWIPLRASIEISMEVSEALAYAHSLTGLDGRSLHMVHRDVSPQNVLVSRQGGVKLADFGIARHDARLEVTQGPTAKGKPGYMAPEQAMGHVVDGRADLYAVGIVLTELISARRVIKNPGAPIAVLSIPARIKELCGVRKDLPRPLADLIIQLTELDPGARPADAREVAQRLREIAAHLPAKDNLTSFLSRVFAKYFPPEALPTSVDPSSDASLPPVGDPFKAAQTSSHHADPSEFPTPPPEAKAELEAGWGKLAAAEVEQPAAAFGGWPAEFREAPSSSRRGAPPLRVPHPSNPKAAPDFAPPAYAPIDSTGKVADVGQVFVPVAAGKFAFAPDEEQKEEVDINEALAGVPTARHAGDAFSYERATKPLVHLTDGALPPLVPPPGLGLGEPASEAETSTSKAKLTARKSSKIAKEEEQKKKLLITAGIGGALVVMIIVLASLFMKKPPAPSLKDTSGAVSVTSSPPGATILLQGQPTEKVTPGSLPDLPFDASIKISVARKGFIADPPEHEVRLSATRREIALDFRLVPARVFLLVTSPAGADVTFNGTELKSKTPIELPAMPLGESATVTTSLPGYTAGFVVLHSAAETATVATLVLDPARVIDIESDPAGAKIFINDAPAGMTPVTGISVPATKPFSLRAERGGFKPYKKTITQKNFQGTKLTFEMDLLPLGSMPMSKEEKARVKELDRTVSRLKVDLAGARIALRRAEANLDRVRNTRQTFVADTASAERAVDNLRSKVEALEARYAEAQDELDALRESIITRIANSEGE